MRKSRLPQPLVLARQVSHTRSGDDTRHSGPLLRRLQSGGNHGRDPGTGFAGIRPQQHPGRRDGAFSVDASASPVAKIVGWVQGSFPGDRTNTVGSKKFSHELVGGDFLSITRLVSVLCANRVVIRPPSGAADASRIRPPPRRRPGHSPDSKLPGGRDSEQPIRMRVPGPIAAAVPVALGDPSVQRPPAAPHQTHAVADILTQQSGLEFLQRFGHVAALPMPGSVHLVLQLVDPLLAASQGIAHPANAAGAESRAKRSWARISR